MTTETSALLDYYSDRAVAHASFFIASIFGILTFSAIVASYTDSSTLPTLINSNPLLLVVGTILFLAFAYMGYNSLITFNHYASLSNDIAAYPIKEKQLWDGYGWAVPKTKGRESQSKWMSVLDSKLDIYKEYSFETYGDNIEKRELSLKKYSLFRLVSKQMSDTYIKPILGIAYWAVIILLGVFSFYNHISNFAWIWVLSLILIIVFLVGLPILLSHFLHKNK